MQSIPVISPINSTVTALAPLLFVLSLSLLREGYEDIQKTKQDNLVNASEALIMEGGQFEETSWADIKVGNIIKVVDEEFFPADLVIIASALPTKICYIETSSLDGEKNLKQRSIPRGGEVFQNLHS